MLLSDPPSADIAWLAERLQSDQTVVASQHYRLHAVCCDVPLLVLPLAGCKVAVHHGQSWTVPPGEYLMLHRAIQLDVENHPPPAGAYRAWALPFPWKVVELARQLLAGHLQPHSAAEAAPISQGPLELLRQALLELLEVAAGDAVQYEFKLLGVLLALAKAGHAQFLKAADQSLASRIRLLVAAAPERDWGSQHFEQEFAISGATLRRRLAEEGCSLREVLRDARLLHGLTLLQSTRKPLKSVALACGYRSVPSFRRQFVERFGQEPAVVAQI